MNPAHHGLARRLLRALACGMLAIATFKAAVAQEVTPELKLSVAQGAAFPLGKAADRWRALLTEGASALPPIKLYPGATLAQRDPTREIMAVAGGAADMAVGSALTWSAQVPALAVYALPWLAPDAREQEALARDSVVQQAVVAKLDALGIVVLHIAPLGQRVLATVKGPVESPADMMGLRIRASTIGVLTDTFASLGAKPSAMTFADAQAAFAAGTLDGQEASASTLAATRIGTAGQKFVTRWGGFSDAMLFVVRRDAWTRLTTAQRAQLQAAAVTAATEADGPAREEAALSDLTRQGISIVRLASAQHAAFRKAVDPVWARWTPLIGPELVRAAEAAVSQAAR